MIFDKTNNKVSKPTEEEKTMENKDGVCPLEQSKVDTNLHIKEVQKGMMISSNEIVKRALVHDASKLESPELETFAIYGPKLKNTTVNTPEYKQQLSEMQVALDHHYANNSHHPEHYENGVNGMNIFDIIEMICDWVAANKRHAHNDIMESLESSKKRFNIDDQLFDIIKNSIKYFA